MTEQNQITEMADHHHTGLPHNTDYQALRSWIATRLESIDEPIFQTEKSNLWDLYLSHLPVEIRQHYNCSCCHRFITRFGRLATIGTDGYARSIFWNIDAPVGVFRDAVTAMGGAVNQARISNIYLMDAERLGVDESGGFTHFFADVPAEKQFSDPLHSSRHHVSLRRQAYENARKAMGTWRTDTLVRVGNLLDPAAGNFGNENLVLPQLEFMLQLKAIKDAYVGEVDSELRVTNRVWQEIAKAGEGMLHFRGGLLGMLVKRVERGDSMDEIKSLWKEATSGINYKRPKTPPAEANKQRAVEMIDKLGLAKAMIRRSATFGDLTTFVWKPFEEPPAQKSEDGEVSAADLFSGIKTRDAKKQLAKQHGVFGDITWRKFAEQILPKAKKISINIPHQVADSWLFHTTAVYPDANPIIRWDKPEKRNPLCYYTYQHGTSAEMVGLTGGWHDVDGIVRLPHEEAMETDETLKSFGAGVVLLVRAARDLRIATMGLFPSTIISELHSIRDVIEQYCRENPLAGRENGDACGLLISQGNNNSYAYRTLRVDLGDMVMDYNITLWD